MKLANWDIALAEFALHMAGEPIVWGKTDCGSLSYAALELVYDAETLEAIKKPAYRGAKSATRLLTANKGGAYPYLRRCGLVPVRRGYWPSGAVWTRPPTKSRPHGAIGIVTMRRVLTSTEKYGVILLTIDEATAASKLLRFADE